MVRRLICPPRHFSIAFTKSNNPRLDNFNSCTSTRCCTSLLACPIGSLLQRGCMIKCPLQLANASRSRAGSYHAKLSKERLADDDARFTLNIAANKRGNFNKHFLVACKHHGQLCLKEDVSSFDCYISKQQASRGSPFLYSLPFRPQDGNASLPIRGDFYPTAPVHLQTLGDVHVLFSHRLLHPRPCAYPDLTSELGSVFCIERMHCCLRGVETLFERENG